MTRHTQHGKKHGKKDGMAWQDTWQEARQTHGTTRTMARHGKKHGKKKGKGQTARNITRATGYGATFAAKEAKVLHADLPVILGDVLDLLLLQVQITNDNARRRSTGKIGEGPGDAILQDVLLKVYSPGPGPWDNGPRGTAAPCVVDDDLPRLLALTGRRSTGTPEVDLHALARAQLLRAAERADLGIADRQEVAAPEHKI